LERKDVVIGAETGSGKTLTYVLPLLERLYRYPLPLSSIQKPVGVILVPTQELVKQIQKVIEIIDPNVIPLMTCIFHQETLQRYRNSAIIVGTPKSVLKVRSILLNNSEL